jgi:hypothetical protein
MSAATQPPSSPTLHRQDSILARLHLAPQFQVPRRAAALHNSARTGTAAQS